MILAFSCAKNSLRGPASLRKGVPSPSFLGKKVFKKDKLYQKFLLDPELLYTLSQDLKNHLLSYQMNGHKKEEARKMAIDDFLDDLTALYPTLSFSSFKLKIKNSKEGVLQVASLLCRPNEYLVIKGTSIGTEGEFENFLEQQWKFVVEGQVDEYKEGSFGAKKYIAGAYSYRGPRERFAYIFRKNTWVIQYGHGEMKESPCLFQSL